MTNTDEKGREYDERPWGSYTVLEDGPTFKVKRIEVLPGKRLSYQRHARRSEHWFVVHGTGDVGRLKIDSAADQVHAGVDRVAESVAPAVEKMRSTAERLQDKVMLLGEIGVGKSSLARRFVFDKFEAAGEGVGKDVVARREFWDKTLPEVSEVCVDGSACAPSAVVSTC